MNRATCVYRAVHSAAYNPGAGFPARPVYMSIIKGLDDFWLGREDIHLIHWRPEFRLSP